MPRTADVNEDQRTVAAIPNFLTRIAYPVWYVSSVAHLHTNRTQLLHRIRRIRGQLDAVERALGEDADCAAVLHPLVACRGALNGLMREVLDGHIRHHIVDPDKLPASEQSRATRELLDVLRAYLK